MFALPRVRIVLIAATLLAGGAFAAAQGGHGGGPPGGGGGGMGGGSMNRGGFGGGNNTPMSQSLRTTPPPPPRNGEMTSSMRGGLQLGPPGRWWDDKTFARSLGLESAQQHRMDDAFNANKPTLVKLYKSLQHEESQLEKMTHGKSLDEAQIFQQIDKVTQAKGEVEKATAHVLLLIRKEMTDEQVSRLEEHRMPATE